LCYNGPPMAKPSPCVSCTGSGELPTENGPVDCPDCGGAGFLPSKSVLTDWRARDLEKSLSRGGEIAAQDVRWILNELHGTRTALHSVIALAHDLAESEHELALRIRMVASGALGLYEAGDSAPESAPQS
jgi:hypothetical protein